MDLQSNASRVGTSSPRPASRHQSRLSLDTPLSHASPSRQADLKIDFIIVGGGIAGLGTAYALASAGHRVRVLEQSSGLRQPAGGIRVPPNLTKILTYWGLADELARKGSPCRTSKLLDLHNGRALGSTAWHKGLMKEMGASYYMMHHQDLHEMLYNLAVSAGVQVAFSASVRSITPPPDAPIQSSSAPSSPTSAAASVRPSVTLSSGETLRADVVIGADGPRSQVRRVVEEDEVEERRSGLSVYSGTLPMREMMRDAGLRTLVESGWPMFFGDQRTVIGYSIRHDTEFAVHVWWDEDDPDATESWGSVVPVTSLPQYKNVSLDPRVRRLLDKIGYLSRRIFTDRARLESWIDSSERVVLVGEAAHPLMPCNNHAASVAIEDAAVLGTLFSHLHSESQIPILLYAYQDLRQQRAAKINFLELSNASVALSAPTSARDTMVRIVAADTSEETPSEDQWAEIAEVWGYDAVDAADEWWVQWGMLRERAVVMDALSTGRSP